MPTFSRGEQKIFVSNIMKVRGEKFDKVFLTEKEY